MRYLERTLAPRLRQAARQFPAIILTGPRRAGKTTLLRACFPQAAYYLLEDPDVLDRVKSDPRAFLEEVRRPAVIDEIQNAPELFRYIRSEVDRRPRRYGQWLLTGSQEVGLMKGVTESMAGRAALFELLPLAMEETPKVSLFRGGFPEVLFKPSAAETWFRSYLQTYLERDIRALSAIRDLTTFRRFLALLASRIGQMLNYTELAAPLGVSVPTISAWLGFLDITRQIILVPPFFENFGKRLVKSPKLYFTDTGLACYLLGLESAVMLHRSPFLGPLFESFVASELLKMQVNRGKRRELYYFRDRQGLEVDFLVALGNRRVLLLEAKASQTVHPRMAVSMQRLQQVMPAYRTKCFVVHLPSRYPPMLRSLAQGVNALTLPELPTIFQP